MSSQKVAKTISTSIYSLWLRVVVLLSWSISITARIVRRIRTGSLSSQHYDELIKIAKLKQSEIHSQTLEEDRQAIVSVQQVFRQCILQGEQQAKCFTLALLLVVLIGLIMTLR